MKVHLIKYTSNYLEMSPLENFGVSRISAPCVNFPIIGSNGGQLKMFLYFTIVVFIKPTNWTKNIGYKKTFTNKFVDFVTICFLKRFHCVTTLSTSPYSYDINFSLYKIWPNTYSENFLDIWIRTKCDAELCNANAHYYFFFKWEFS